MGAEGHAVKLWWECISGSHVRCMGKRALIQCAGLPLYSSSGRELQSLLTKPLESYEHGFSEKGVFKGHSKTDCQVLISMQAVSAVRFSPCGSLLASGSADRSVHIWDVTKGELIRSFTGHVPQQGINDVAWAIDSRILATASDDKRITMWDTRQGSPVRELAGHKNYVFSVRFNPSSTLLASGGYDELCCVWDVCTGRCLRTMSAHSGPISSVSWSHDGSLLATASFDGLCRLWDLSTGQWDDKILRTLLSDSSEGGAVTFALFSPNSRYLLIGCRDNRWRLFDYLNGDPKLNLLSKRVRVFAGHVNANYCLSAAWVVPSDQPPCLVSGSEDGSLYLWDVSSQQLLQQIKGHNDVVCAIDAHPDGRLLASGALEKDPCVRLWSRSA